MNPILQVDESVAKLAPPDQPQFGKVISYSGGKAKILIDGDKTAENTQYQCVKSCVPSAGDRVFFVRTGGTILIIGVI